jgi:hypothetical protein
MTEAPPHFSRKRREKNGPLDYWAVEMFIRHRHGGWDSDMIRDSVPL